MITDFAGKMVWYITEINLEAKIGSQVCSENSYWFRIFKMPFLAIFGVSLAAGLKTVTHMITNLAKKMIWYIIYINLEAHIKGQMHSDNLHWVRTFEMAFLGIFRWLSAADVKTVTQIFTNFTDKMVWVIFYTTCKAQRDRSINSEYSYWVWAVKIPFFGDFSYFSVNYWLLD